MNSYPSLVPRYAVKYHSGISAPSGLKQYCYNVFVYVCPLMIVLKLTKENDSDKTLLNFKL